MATPINPTSNGDLWHLSIEDLLAPMPQTPKLGGAGPFVINLTASTAPITPPKDFTVDESTHVYQVQRTEDHRTRYRLRIGPFATEDEADAALGKVRETYPGALTATAETEDLRAILSWQAKRDALRLAAERAQSAMKSEPVPFEIAPIPTLTTAVATRKAQPTAVATAAAPAPQAAAPAPQASAPAPQVTAPAPQASAPAPQAYAREPAPLVATQAPTPAATPPVPAPAAAPAAATSVRATFLQNIRSARKHVPVSSGAGARLQSLAALNLSPISSRPFTARVPPAPVAARPLARGTVTPPAGVSSTAAAAAVPAPSPAPTSAAPTSASPGSPSPSSPSSTGAVPASAAPTGTSPATPPTRSVESPPVLAAAEPSSSRAPLGAWLSSRSSSGLPPLAPTAAPSSASRPHVPRPGKMPPSAAPSAARPPMPPGGPHSGRRTAGAALPSVPNFESTQTVRALTPLEIENTDGPRWFVIQLGLADTAFDPENLPNCDIFSEYRLYAVTGFDQGRVIHALRLGFFAEEVAAAAVASYLAAYYEKPTIKRVSAAERERFAHHTLMARKDIGATGKHAVIEITNERVVRERRDSTIPVGELGSSIPPPRPAPRPTAK